jgi:hypothetical protein
MFKVKNKWVPYLLILVMAAAVIIIKTTKNKDQPTVTNNKPKDPAGNNTNRDKGFDRRISLIEYSNHARCRMQCRHISQTEVEETMQEGKINYDKSDLQNARCPRYTVEAVTRDNQRVRIVYAQCNRSTTIVTVIDLGTDYDCDCPGDDKNYENRN